MDTRRKRRRAGKIEDTMEKMFYCFLTVTKEPLTVYGVTFPTPPLVLSTHLLRGATCPERCGACCTLFTLDYIPGEPCVPEVTARDAEIAGRTRKILTYYPTPQLLYDKYPRCEFLDPETGRCKIYPNRPLSCRLEPTHFQLRKDIRFITTGPFSRGWNMRRVTGEKGALCEFHPLSEEEREGLVKKFVMLKRWTDYFGIETWIPEIIQWVKCGYDERIVLKRKSENEGFLHIIRNSLEG